MRRPRVAIATAGRFHVLDLARELSSLGYDVAFYSYVPKKRAVSFGLPPECHVSLLPFAAPALALNGSGRAVSAAWKEWLTWKTLNAGLQCRLRPCDLLICMSGIYLEAAEFAKRRYRSAVWLERGSVHIKTQREILRTIPGAEQPNPLAIPRELAGYALADRIVVASSYAESSFAEYPALAAKLFKNPYGVDCRSFAPVVPKPRGSVIRLIFVGTWSLRKGCDLLAEAVRQTKGVSLLHVGAIGDAGFPSERDKFVHHDAVPQSKLPGYYAMADVAVLFSREDGFGVVIGQALASGLPVICSTNTGAADLAKTAALKERIAVVSAGNGQALRAAIEDLAGRIRATGPFPPLSAEDRSELSWEAYGRRYAAEIEKSFCTPRRESEFD